MSDVIDLAAEREKRSAEKGVMVPEIQDHGDVVAVFVDGPDAAILLTPFPDCGEANCQSHAHGGFNGYCMSRETARVLAQKLLKAADYQPPTDAG